jgi:small subunit ribosomal protein S20
VPHHKSAKKRVKTNEVRRKRNVARRSRMRHAIRDVRDKLATATVLDAAQLQEVVAVGSLLDRMAGKGVIHPNKAARLKSRLQRQANARTSSSD